MCEILQAQICIALTALVVKSAYKPLNQRNHINTKGKTSEKAPTSLQDEVIGEKKKVLILNRTQSCH